MDPNSAIATVNPEKAPILNSTGRCPAGSVAVSALSAQTKDGQGDH